MKLPKKLELVSVEYEADGETFKSFRGSSNNTQIETINELIDYVQYLEYTFMKHNAETLSPEMEKLTCGKIMSVGLAGETYCANPVPCHLHDKNPVAALKELHRIYLREPLPKDWGKIKVDFEHDSVMSRINRVQNAYTKGQENGKKQERKRLLEISKKVDGYQYLIEELYK